MKRAIVGTSSLVAAFTLGLALVPAMANAEDEMMAEEPMAEEDAGIFPGELSGNVGYYSDYRFRGISQTGEEFAIQGGLDLGLPGGLYVGTWASNVEFGGPEVAEVDLYAGWGTELAGGLSLDTNAVFFWYPGDEAALNYWEFSVGLGYSLGPVDLSGKVIYSPEYFDFANSGWVFGGGVAYGIPLPDSSPVSVGIDANIGYTLTQDDLITDDDYVDWNIGVSVAMASNWEGLAFDFRYVDTDLPETAGQDATFVYGVSYSF